MKILVLENEPEAGHALIDHLQEWKMDAVPVGDYQQAWKILSDSAIDLLIAELVMPGMTGVELVRQVRQIARYKNLPVLMISGGASKKHIIEAAQVGINGIIARPFNLADLKKKVLGIYKLHKRLSSQQQTKLIWEGRTTSFNDVSGPLAVIGEAVNSVAELCQPENRGLVTYLSHFREVVGRYNSEDSELNIGYVLESDTANILLHLKRHATREWIKLILLSAKCHGNPTLVARLFMINRQDDLPFFLVYDRPDDISSTHRDGLKRLGIKTINRSKLDGERIPRLIDQYMVDKREKKAAVTETEKPLSPQQVQGRIVADLETMTNLPPLPKVYEKIVALSKDPESDLKDWIKAIKVDPMTCTTILRHANSLSYGFKGEVKEIDRAVILLGKNAVAGLVASEAVRQAFTAIEEQGFILEDFWAHNVAVGFAAHILSFPLSESEEGSKQGQNFAALGLSKEVVELLQSINLPRRLRLDYDRENPFVGGIMHDIGKAVMVHSYPGLYPLLLAELKRNNWGVPMAAAEREVAGGLTHTGVGEILLRKWEMEDSLCNVVLNHHQSDISDTYTFLVGVADIIGQILYPFPREAQYPLAAALENGSLEQVGYFLPAGFFDQPLLSVAEFTSLARALSPRIKYFTEKMRRSVREG